MRLSKSKLIGLAALLVAFALIAGTLVWRNSRPKPVEITSVDGYLGGEKIGLFDDPQFNALAAKDGLKVDYRKAGSLDMMTADRKGLDYLFPSSRAAVDYGKAKGVDTSTSDIVFNSPIVMYTHKAVADALVGSGIMSRANDVYTMDMSKAVAAMSANKTWGDVGWPSGYGQFRIDSTDPIKSNSGNEYAALVAATLNGGQPATVASIQRDAPALTSIFGKSGWMETSSEDSFNQFLTLGVGSKPIMVGYESQILDLAANNPDAWKQVKDDIVIAYPTPTVWSTHVLIPTNAKGQKLLALLKKPETQKLAWERHGFRSANFTGASSITRFGVPGTLDQITAVAELPRNDAMQSLIEVLTKGTQQ
ncbi:MAG: hypothetical protein LKF49_08740 [Bifidobacterium tibiigranuli]|jgi:hypothetical protein|nr:hypothetical protein [Bifidobacterium tibiigranuli]MCH3974535.1 hypothetical protein [Bifidobacterium tibiigranuli]MCH4189453.1 hypothetical protein [Bifidobacterium tibiigranuli]MCH4204276.1 hypothetical protein [Bifidobacterium tibiigranuli]MCH4275526.1 hypothetical protein [Bifidobacterium tibiigranuli]MCI1791528.1 hypothetical protein [Bifidobacterium tibiigranuli]